MTTTIWIALVLVIPAAFLTLALHELSHCIAVWRAGGRVTGFRPYPHLHDGAGGVFFWPQDGWKLRWAGMSYEGVDMRDRASMYIAPLVKALIVFVLWGALCGILGGVYTWEHWWALLVPWFWELTGILNWVQGYFRPGSNNDGKKFRRATGW